MTVSVIFLIFVITIALKNEISTLDINTLLIVIACLLANGIISICSRLDDLKRK